MGQRSAKRQRRLARAKAASNKSGEQGAHVTKPSLRSPVVHIARITKVLPDVWKEVDRVRSWRGKEVPGWPDWCFLPLVGAHTILTAAQGDDISVSDFFALEAIAAWRVTQGIYRFDPTIFESLWETPVTGDIPGEVLHHLPEWCCYIACERTVMGHSCYGFFVHLDYDIDQCRSELHLVLDNKDDHLTPAVIFLAGTVEEGIEAALSHFAQRTDARQNDNWPKRAREFREHANAHRSDLEGMISLALYLASTNAEIGSPAGDSPTKPKPVLTKAGARMSPPDKPRVWDVAIRTGAALRRAREATAAVGEDAGPASGRPHGRPRAHIRRAHLHTFLAGPRDADRERRVKWLSPIPVNVTDESPVIPTIREIE